MNISGYWTVKHVFFLKKSPGTDAFFLPLGELNQIACISSQL